jgi:hypothetical protein
MEPSRVLGFCLVAICYTSWSAYIGPERSTLAADIFGGILVCALIAGAIAAVKWVRLAERIRAAARLKSLARRSGSEQESLPRDDF